ncbi:MAG: cytochrome b/b6 domain-containing protein [Sphingomonadales bacterium]|nr:cytochrome b/b6 domain-containing protein [Sphingomonadales bacterium]
MVKLTHWGIVTAVVANALVTEAGSGAHVWVGYGLAVLLALRLLWGLIGPAEARFSAFPPSPRRALAHLREIASGHVTRHASHNPLGALMVYAIWTTLAVVIASGIAMAGLPTAERTGGRESAQPAMAGSSGAGDEEPATPGAAASPDRAADEEREEREERAGHTAVPAPRDATGQAGPARDRDAAGATARDDEDGEAEEDEREEGPLGEVHEAAVNLLYLLIALHLAGVIFETRRSGREIVLAMVPGRR